MTDWATGRCLCNAAQYTLLAPPMITHACHCRDCQRITGGPFVVNMWVEETKLTLSGELERRALASGSDKGQELSACAKCGGHLLTRYLASPPGAVFVRATLLDDPAMAPPDVHIFTRSRVSWLPALDAPRGVFEGFYDLKAVWPPESLARLRALRTPAPSET